MSEMRFLVYNDISLATDYRAGNINAFMSFLQWLAQQGHVTVLHTHYRRPDRELPENVEVIWRPDWINFLVRNVRARLGRSLPFLMYKDSWFKRYCFKRLIGARTWDAVFIEYLDNFFLIKHCQVPPTTKVIADLHDLMSARGESFRQQGIATRENLDIDLRSELNAIASFDRVICLQASEAAVVNEHLGEGKALITRRNPGVSVDEVSSVALSRKRDTPLKLGFMGTTTEFNVDAAHQLLGPFYSPDDVEYKIAGSVCQRLGDMQARGNVNLLGRVASVAEFYAGIDVAVNMIRFGSGLKTKNVEALLFGVSVITTTVGAEGLEDFVQNGLYIADNRDEWDAALRVITSSDNPIADRSALRMRASVAFNPDTVFATLKAFLTTASGVSTNR